MKKLLVSLLTVMMMFAYACTVSAATSPTKSTSTSSSKSGYYTNVYADKVTANNTVKIVTSNELDRLEIGDFAKAAGSRSLSSTAKVSQFFELDVLDANGNKTHGATTVTFDLTGTNRLTNVKEAGLIHVIDGTNTYEVVRGTVNGNKLTVSLSSTSKVAFYFDYTNTSALEPVVNTGVR